MTKLNYLWAVFILAVFFTSCSKDDEGTPVIFTSLTATKAHSFIEDNITINIAGEEFMDVIVTSNNSSVTITELTNISYSIEASEAAVAVISVQLINESNTAIKDLVLSFNEHGVTDFSVVEGIEIGFDKSDKIMALFGDPEGKEDSSSGEREYWYYFSKGFSFLVNKSNTIAEESRLYGSDWKRTINSVELNGSHYSNEISDSMIIANGQVVMDTIINKLGQPDEKHTSTMAGSPLKWYIFNEGAKIFFLSDSIDDYTGKTVLYVDIF